LFVPWFFRYLIALLPVVVTVGGWKLAVWAYANFSCQGNLKSLEPCFWGSINLTPWIAIGLFWCQLLSWVAAPLSLLLFLNVFLKHIEARQNSAQQKNLTHHQN
jgi:hypothetical protein